MTMRTFYSLPAAIVLILVATESRDAQARASQGGHDPWNAEHIDRLPPEIRGALTQMCGSPPRAGHYFATYRDNARMIRLHFEHLNCSEQARFCNGVSCLQQEYLSSGGHYRLIRTFHASGDD
jgi:hypothetical protein